MNILLINPPGKISFVSPPLGLLYIAASLKEDGHNVSLVDYNLEKISDDDLGQIITEKKMKPSAFPLSLQRSTGLWNWPN